MSNGNGKSKREHLLSLLVFPGILIIGMGAAITFAFFMAGAA